MYPMVGRSAAEVPAYQAPPAYQHRSPGAGRHSRPAALQISRSLLTLASPAMPNRPGSSSISTSGPVSGICPGGPLSGDRRSSPGQLPDSDRVGVAGRGLVKAFRYGLVMPGGSRIVFDLTGPAKIAKSYVLEAASGQPPGWCSNSRRWTAPPLSGHCRPKTAPNCGLRSPRPTQPLPGGRARRACVAAG